MLARLKPTIDTTSLMRRIIGSMFKSHLVARFSSTSCSFSIISSCALPGNGSAHTAKMRSWMLRRVAEKAETGDPRKEVPRSEAYELLVPVACFMVQLYVLGMMLKVLRHSGLGGSSPVGLSLNSDSNTAFLSCRNICVKPY